MKHYWLVIVFGIILLSLTGCYTQIATTQDDTEVYYEPIQPIIIIYPEPMFIPVPILPSDPPYESSTDQEYKYRNPQTNRPNDSKEKERIRNSGGRNNTGGRR